MHVLRRWGMDGCWPGGRAGNGVWSTLAVWAGLAIEDAKPPLAFWRSAFNLIREGGA